MIKDEIDVLTQKTKVQIEKLEERVGGIKEDLSDEANAFWNTLKNRFGQIKTTLHKTEETAELKSHLGIMEARDKLETIRSSAESFLYTVSKNTAKEIDIVELKAHLAKMDAEEQWEETQKNITRLYSESKIEAEKLAKQAAVEMNDIMVKLSKVV
jgi:hypothetical protein